MATNKQKTLAQLMKKKGATGVPNEATYIATAQEQAQKGQLEDAEATMQYSISNPAKKDIENQDETEMKANDKKSSERYKKYIKAMKNSKKR